MHKETLNAMGKSRNSTLLFTMLLFISLLFIVAISNFLYNRYQAPYISYGVFLAYGLIGLWVYRKKILEYRYSLIGDELIFEQIVGKREKPIISIKIKNVLYFGPVQQQDDFKGKVDKSYHLLFWRRPAEDHTIIAKCEGQVVRIVFRPSASLVEMIRNCRRG